MDILLNRILQLIPKKPNGDFEHGEIKKFADILSLKSGNVISDWRSDRSSSYKGKAYEIAGKYHVSLDWLKGEGWPVNMFWDEFVKVCDEKGTSPSEVAFQLQIPDYVMIGWKNGARPDEWAVKNVSDYLDINDKYLKHYCRFSYRTEEWREDLEEEIGRASDNKQLLYLLEKYGVPKQHLYDIRVNAPEKEKSTPKGELIKFDSFDYAMQNETKELAPEDKQVLLDMAKRLNAARKRATGNS